MAKLLFKNTRKGFTLIEISIVIIIISAISILIISGKSIIESTKITGLISEWRWYQKSVKNFRDAYQYWPGDLPANLRGGRITKLDSTSITYSSATTEGNMFINRLDAPAATFGETVNAFRQLTLFTAQDNKLFLNVTTSISTTINDAVLDQLIPRISYLSKSYHWMLASIGFTSATSAAFGSQKPVFNNLYSVSLTISSLESVSSYSTPNFTAFKSTPSTLASKIDAKGDDGRPFSGQIGSIITNVLTDAQKYASTPTNAVNPCVNTLSSNAISDSTITSSVEYSTSSSGKCWLTFLLDSA